MIIIKSKETKTGVKFRALKDNKYIFLDVEFNNYFYIKYNLYQAFEEDFRRTFGWCIKEVIAVGEFAKIMLSSNFMRNKVRQFWDPKGETFEADILANKRFLLDKSPELNNQDIPFTFFDIETDDRLPLQKDERGLVLPASRIVSFSGVDHNGEVMYFALEDDTDADEKELLKSIVGYFAKYGIVSGWNSLRFDMPFIKGRCDRFKVDYTILDFVNHLDYLEMFKKYDRKSRKSYSLNNISNEVLHESKIDQAKGNGAIWNTWLHDKEQLKRYNIEDSNLVYKIDKKVEFVKLSMNMANLSKCHTQNTLNNSDFGDYLLLREYKADGIIMPSKPTREEVEARKLKGKIGGGYTTCFETGLHKKVHIWDFKSEYPSAIITWNISPETYIDTIYNEADAAKVDRTKYIITPHDFESNVYHPARLYKKAEGVIPRVVRKLVAERDKTKYAMKEFIDSDPDKYKKLFMHQYALKTIANSIYGILSFTMSRYYSYDLGDSVTTCARATLKACNEKVKTWNCIVLGGDTDSSFVLLPDDMSIEIIDAKYVEFLQTWADRFGCINNRLVFEYEKTFDLMFFVKKKHYAYKIGDKKTIKGMEAIKSDTNKKAAEMQRDFIYEVLDEVYKPEVWQTKVEELHDKVFDQELKSDELELVKALTKMPKDYIGPVTDSKTGQPKIKANGEIQMKAIPAHVKLAEREIAQGIDLYPGSKIHYIVIKDKPILAISPEEFAKEEGTFPYKHKKHGEIDYEWAGEYDAGYYWIKILKPLIKVIYAYHKHIPDWNFSLTKSQYKKILAIED